MTHDSSITCCIDSKEYYLRNFFIIRWNVTVFNRLNSAMSQKVGDFQEDNFEQKLLGLKDTQDSIQSLSAWCLKYQQQHKKVVSCWLHVLRKVKVEQRVTLFYLANDVIQYSKRRNYPFVESWATALQKATPLVRDDKVKHKILRLFKIWGERNVYDDTFLSDLSGLLTVHTKKNTVSTADLIQDFQPSLLFAKIRRCKVLEEDTDLKLKLVKQSNIPVYDDIDAVQVAVKDRQNCDDFLLDVDDGIVRLEAYTKALELEIKERIEVINVLEVSEQFYDTQRGEAKVVCNAYRNFGSRIKTLKRKLEELLPTLPSPVPSPDIDAPSPSSGSDLEIPDENKTAVCYDSEKSFIGTDFVTAMNAAKENQSEYIRHMQQQQHQQASYDPGVQMQYGLQNVQNSYENYVTKDARVSSHGYYKGNPIEVINSSQTESLDFNENNDGRSFLQNVIANPSSSLLNPSQSKIPGLGSPTENTRDIFNFIESKEKVEKDVSSLPWIEKPITKYQSWPSPDLTWNNSQETPVSPPAFEQESYSNPVEYVDTNVDSRFPSPFRESHQPADVDHRIFNAPPPKNMGSSHDYNELDSLSLPKNDVDNRCLPLHNSVANRNNLIALTDSPSVNDTWKPTDSDYRTIPMPPTPPIALSTPDSSGRISKPPIDNIESVDMEMSDDEEGKHEDRNRPRRSSVKDDEENSKRNDHQSQLLPPPNPWDMVTVSHLDNDDDANDVRKNELSFHKIPPPNFMGSMGPMEPPRLPMHDFSRFPAPPAPPGGGLPLCPPPGLTASNGALNPMNFSQPSLMNVPPPQDNRMFTPRMDFSPSHRTPGPNCGQPFNNFMPYGKLSNRPPAVFSQSSGNTRVNQSSMNNSFQKSFDDERSRSYENASSGTPNDGSYSSAENEKRFRRNSVSNIEPIINKNRSFDKRVSDELFDNVGPNQPKSVGPRSNLKEISLSDVLEKSMLQSQSFENDSVENENKGNQSAIDNDDLFSEEAFTNDNTADDGDDLYNNIEETAVHSEETVSVSDNALSTPNRQSASGDNKMRQKTPFQGTVPKVARLPMTPAATIEDDERNPWPIMPIIDLSDENSGSGDGVSQSIHSQENEATSQAYNSPFLRRGGFQGDSRSRFHRGGPRFLSSGDRNFSNSAQTPPSRRGRFSSPRNDFRPRGLPGMFGSSNQDQMRGGMRHPFNRSPDVGPRLNFQNSPRMFSGRPQRMFRRGW